MGRIDRLLSTMTIEEKIGQLNMVASSRVVTGPGELRDVHEGIRAGRIGDASSRVTVTVHLSYPLCSARLCNAKSAPSPSPPERKIGASTARPPWKRNAGAKW